MLEIARKFDKHFKTIFVRLLLSFPLKIVFDILSDVVAEKGNAEEELHYLVVFKNFYTTDEFLVKTQ